MAAKHRRSAKNAAEIAAKIAAEASAWEKQIGGSHYATMAIQPSEYIQKNHLDWLEGCVIKYASRWKQKNGREDLKKAIHCLEMLIELDEAENG